MKLELWRIAGKGNLDIQRLKDVGSLEEAVTQATRLGKGKYHVCDGEGNLVIFKVVRLPVVVVPQVYRVSSN